MRMVGIVGIVRIVGIVGIVRIAGIAVGVDRGSYCGVDVWY